MIADAVEAWPARLERALTPGGVVRSVRVLAETASTQDAARRLGVAPGDAVVAWRQTAGRGRLGRPWADTADEGIAVTVALPAAASALLAMRGGVATATAAGRWLRPGTVGLKWPNDVLVGGRKLAGVLVEQSGELALLGIGMNVNQTRWPAALAGRAVSLLEARRESSTACGGDAPIVRVEVVAALLETLALAAALPEPELARRFEALLVRAP